MSISIKTEEDFRAVDWREMTAYIAGLQEMAAIMSKALLRIAEGDASDPQMAAAKALAEGAIAADRFEREWGE